MEFEHLLYNFS